VNAYARSLLRFWWVLVIGLIFAQVAAIVAVYKVDLSSFPPSLSERSASKYSAQGRLLVTDEDSPHLRVSVTRTVQPATVEGNEDERPPIQVTQAPDYATLVERANVFPLFIESDPVADVRRKMFGPLPGTLRAQAIYAVSTPSRFTPSRVPVIQLIGVSDTPKGAINLVKHTSTAFIRWMRDEQNAAGLKAAERITVERLQTPRSAVAFGGASSTLPVLVFGVVLMAFVALAVFFDRIFPRAKAVAATESVVGRRPA
jgi:hypothetical protein